MISGKKKDSPKTYFVYDTQEKEFSRYIIYNGDYTSKNEFYMVMLTLSMPKVNHGLP